jgi:hypothetical protein
MNDKNVWLGPNYLTTPNYLDLDWCAANGWDISIGADTFADYQSNAAWDADMAAALQLCLENRIMVQFNLNATSEPWDTGGPAFNASTPPSSYQSTFGDLIEHIDSLWGPDGSEGYVIKNYWFESGYDNFMSWLLPKTTTPLRQGIFGQMWRNSGTQYSLWADFETRLSQVDGVDVEVWNVYDATIIQPSLVEYMHDNHPEMSLGIDSTSCVPPEFNNGTYWTMTGQYGDGGSPADPNPSIAEAERRYATYLWQLKQLTAQGSFDVLECEVSSSNDSGRLSPITTPTWWEWVQPQMEFQPSLQLLEGSHVVDLMNIAYLT